jgi:hypothetical protein
MTLVELGDGPDEFLGQHGLSLSGLLIARSWIGPTMHEGPENPLRWSEQVPVKVRAAPVFGDRLANRSLEQAATSPASGRMAGVPGALLERAVSGAPSHYLESD